jgi:hypothetical protein
LPAAVDRKRALIDPDHPHLSICRQCELLDLNRSTYYLPPATESEEDLRLMRLIDRQYLETPFYGSRKMAESLNRAGEAVNVGNGLGEHHSFGETGSRPKRVRFGEVAPAGVSWKPTGSTLP